MLDVRDTDSGRRLVNTLTGFLIVAVVLAVALAGGLWQIRAARREDAKQDQFIREGCTPGLDVWDDHANRWITLPPGVKPGPGQYTDREVVSLDQLELAWDAPAYGETTVDPAWDAGCERLWDAIRDERQKGDQA